MMNHILEMNWIKQKTCWMLIHQRCNRPHEIITNLSALCLIVKGSFMARTAHSCGSDSSVTLANRCLGGGECASRLPLARRASDSTVGYYVGVLLPLGQATRRLKLGLLRWLFAWECFSLCICGSGYLINQSSDHSWGFFHPAPTLLRQKKKKIKIKVSLHCRENSP